MKLATKKFCSASGSSCAGGRGASRLCARFTRSLSQSAPHRVLDGGAERRAHARESLRRKFDRYVHGNQLDADLHRKAYSAVAAKLARILYGLIKHGTDYRPFFEDAIPIEEGY